MAPGHFADLFRWMGRAAPCWSSRTGEKLNEDRHDESFPTLVGIFVNADAQTLIFIVASNASYGKLLSFSPWCRCLGTPAGE